MDGLIKKAIKTMEDNPGFNEIELSDGVNQVRLVRFTPSPWCVYPWAYWTYQQPYNLRSP